MLDEIERMMNNQRWDTANQQFPPINLNSYGHHKSPDRLSLLLSAAAIAISLVAIVVALLP